MRAWRPSDERRSRRRATLVVVPLVFASLAALSSSCVDGTVPDGGDGPVAPCAIAPTVTLHAVDEGPDCAAIRALRLPASLPPPRGNAYADREDAAVFGFYLFYDARLSSNLDVRCASCHLPELEFDDEEPLPTEGKGFVPRNSPTVLGAAWQKRQFWDGRADSLWSQPLFAIEAPNEMDYTRLEVAHRMVSTFADDYEAIFGPLPDLSDAARFPPDGRPGDPAWENMAPADQDLVNRVFANVGKSLDAYMRRLATGDSRLDLFLAGDPDALTDVEQRGLSVFVSARCIDCHNGPLLTDELHYNLGVPQSDSDALDRGRVAGAAVLLNNPFSLYGPYADDLVDEVAVDLPTLDELEAEAADPAMEGAFRTQSLRNIAGSAPYGHNGAFATLVDVLDHHLTAAGSGDYAGVVTDAIAPVSLDDDDKDALRAFLAALDGAYPGLPWASWPDR